MGFHPNGEPHPTASRGLNSYALVIYIPEPLGGFLDDLRRELVPGCKPHAHVSVLPPRPLAAGDTAAAAAELRARAAAFEPFEIQASDIEVFPVTNVIYINIHQGSRELRSMHAALSTGPLRFEEPFQYHPHITLAQDLQPGQLAEITELARRRWAEYSGSRLFRAERVVFVQNTLLNGWIDLEEVELRAVPVR